MTIKQLVEILQRCDAPDAIVSKGEDVARWEPVNSVDITWDKDGIVTAVVLW